MRNRTDVHKTRIVSRLVFLVCSVFVVSGVLLGNTASIILGAVAAAILAIGGFIDPDEPR